jgi:O-antigen ligase
MKTDNKNQYTAVDFIIILLIVNIMFSGINYLSTYSYIQFFLIDVLLFFKMYKEEFRFNYILVFFLSITFYTFISGIWAIARLNHIVYGLKLVSSIFLFFNMTKYNNWTPFLLKCIKVISIIYAVYTILVYIIGIPIYNIISFIFPNSTYEKMLSALSYGAVSGIPGEVSLNAFSILLGYIIILWEMLFCKKKHKLGYALLLILCFVAILMTKKRSILLIVIALSILAILYYILVSVKLEQIIKNIKKIIGIIAATVSAVVIIVVLSKLYPQVFSVFDRFKQDNLLAGREDLYMYAIQIFKQRPMVGFGYDSFGAIVIAKDGSLTSALSGAHNVYLQLLAETGLIGFLLLVSLFIYNLSVTIKKIISDPRNKYLLISIFVQLSFLVYGLSGNTLFVNSQLLAYFVFCGLIYYNEEIEVINVN